MVLMYEVVQGCYHQLQGAMGRLNGPIPLSEGSYQRCEQRPRGVGTPLVSAA